MEPSSSAQEYGTLAPGYLDRAVIALTSRLPDNWFGMRLAILFRRITTMRLAYPAGALEVVRWGMRLRLHPRDNGCEKNLLFTPQMYEPTELSMLAELIDQAKAENRNFAFIDIGANVGLFSFFVAARAGTGARILAVEPEPGTFGRLHFNVLSNPGVPIRLAPIALGDEPGEHVVELQQRDRGGTRTRKATDKIVPAGESRVEARTLLQFVRDEKIDAIDAIKIDVEGAEDVILAPFFHHAPKSLWPRLLLMEDARDSRTNDLLALLAAKGFVVKARTKLNVMLLRV